MAKKSKLASWLKHCHLDSFGADIFETNFPLLYGTSIAISTFPEKKVLDVGEVLQSEFQGDSYLASVDISNRRRIYAVPNSTANACLSLQCLFEGDCIDWNANQAYFSEGKLVAVISNFSSTNIPDVLHLVELQKNSYSDAKTLKDIYKQEIDRVARDTMDYNEKPNPFGEMVRILKADSPRGKELNDSYRDAIREVLVR